MGKKLHFLLSVMALMCIAPVAQAQSDAEYQKALDAITDGNYYRIYTEADGATYYLTADGKLAADETDAYSFEFKAVQVSGTLYETGWNLGCNFSNPAMSGSNGTGNVKNDGSLKKDAQNRDTWERQVFFLNDNGEYAVRSTNANSTNWGANTYWTVLPKDSALPTAGYAVEAAYVWKIEDVTADILLAKAKEVIEAKELIGSKYFETPEDAYNTYADAVKAAEELINADGATAEDKAKAVADLKAANNAYAAARKLPVKGKAYTIANITIDGNLCVGDNKVTVDKNAEVYFTAVNGGYAISNEEGEYIFKTTTNTWTLATTTELAKAYVLSVNPVEGGYTIQGKNGLLGTDATNAGATVFADKSIENNGLWDIAEVAPKTFFIEIADTENGTVTANATEAEAGETIALTITPVKGYELDELTVTYGEGKSVNVADDYTFTMPKSDVTIKAVFGEIATPEPNKEYLPNPSFELSDADTPLAEEIISPNAIPAIYGWTLAGMGEGEKGYSNTEVRKADSETISTSTFGTSNPSEGNYSLFIRQGWNPSTGNKLTITSDALAKLPAGDYILSVDYKQRYAYDEDKQKNENTYVAIALNSGDNAVISTKSEAAQGDKHPSYATTYFNDTEWSTLSIPFSLETSLKAGSQVVITLNAAGSRRSDFYIDNVRLVYVTSVELVLSDLADAIAVAQAEADKYMVGDGLFQYPETEMTPLTDAIATAKAAYEAAESKETVIAATEALLAAVEAFAPAYNAPVADKAYTLSLTTPEGTFQLNTEDGIKIQEEGTPIYFVAQDNDTYALSNGEEYINYTGTDNNKWSLGLTSSAYGWTFTVLADGQYTIHGKNGFMGTNNSADKTPGDAAGSTCYGDKSASNGNYIWNIEEYVEPVRYSIEIAATENGTVTADMAKAKAGETITLTITPAEGYKLGELIVTYGEDNAAVEVSGGYTFTMPEDDVTIVATFIEDISTAIGNISDTSKANGKYLKDGKVIIYRNDTKYSINGNVIK